MLGIMNPRILLGLFLLVGCSSPASESATSTSSPIVAAVAPYARSGYFQEQDVKLDTDLVWTGESRVELSCDDGFKLAHGGCASGSVTFTRNEARGNGWICTTRTAPPATIGVWIECTP